MGRRLHGAGMDDRSVAAAFSSQVLFFSFGMVGEYLIRILTEVRKPPRCIVRCKGL